MISNRAHLKKWSTIFKWIGALNFDVNFEKNTIRRNGSVRNIFCILFIIINIFHAYHTILDYMSKLKFFNVIIMGIYLTFLLLRNISITLSLIYYSNDIGKLWKMLLEFSTCYNVNHKLKEFKFVILAMVVLAVTKIILVTYFYWNEYKHDILYIVKYVIIQIGNFFELSMKLHYIVIFNQLTSFANNIQYSLKTYRNSLKGHFTLTATRMFIYVGDFIKTYNKSISKQLLVFLMEHFIVLIIETYVLASSFYKSENTKVWRDDIGYELYLTVDALIQIGMIILPSVLFSITVSIF